MVLVLTLVLVLVLVRVGEGEVGRKMVCVCVCMRDGRREMSVRWRARGVSSSFPSALSTLPSLRPSC